MRRGRSGDFVATVRRGLDPVKRRQRVRRDRSGELAASVAVSLCKCVAMFAKVSEVDRVQGDLGPSVTVRLTKFIAILAQVQRSWNMCRKVSSVCSEILTCACTKGRLQINFYLVYCTLYFT